MIGRPRTRSRLSALCGLSVLALAAALVWRPPSSLAQGPDCLDPVMIDDIDVTRAAADLADPVLCLSIADVSSAGVVWRLVVIRNLAEPGPLWAVPHDEENAAFAAGVYAVLRYGGIMVAVENDERRNVEGLDPNHVFAADGAQLSRCDIDEPPVEFIDAFLGFWDRSYPVVGLHSNWDGFAEAGGRGTISVNRQDEKMIPFPSPVAVGRFADEDTIAMLVSTIPPLENASGRAAIDWFNRRGVHVVYRHVTDANNDCTLADFLTLNRLGDYVNLEVEHGDVDTQKAMVDLLIEFFATGPFH